MEKNKPLQKKAQPGQVAIKSAITKPDIEGEALNRHLRGEDAPNEHQGGHIISDAESDAARDKADA